MALTLALTLTACVGSGQQVNQQLSTSDRALMMIGLAGTRIDKEQYSDLYEALLESDYSRSANLMRPSTPSTQQRSSGSITIVGIKTIREAQTGPLDDLLHYTGLTRAGPRKGRHRAPGRVESIACEAGDAEIFSMVLTPH
ncbi:MAG: hypothetical protein KAS94_15295 [Desulfobulbaceae bacterium]|nr:hypothetical protein [Desulfobulbaceae bacterium]